MSKVTEPIGTKVRGQKEFSEEQIKAARKKDKRFAAEMGIYNLRALRGDFDTY